jgi:hypothetical protein
MGLKKTKPVAESLDQKYDFQSATSHCFCFLLNTYMMVNLYYYLNKLLHN